MKAFEDAVKYTDSQITESHLNHNSQPNLLKSQEEPVTHLHKIRGTKPIVPEKSRAEKDMIKIIEWILSDGSLPTNEEILKETRTELGFKRSGKKIDNQIRQAIKKVRHL